MIPDEIRGAKEREIETYLLYGGVLSGTGNKEVRRNHGLHHIQRLYLKKMKNTTVKVTMMLTMIQKS